MKPFVTCQLFGQLGNQLFQVATTLAYALDTGADPLFPALHQTTDRISYNRDRIFFRLNSNPLPRPIRHVFQVPEAQYYSAQRPPPAEDLLLSGYFQSWRHFDHRRKELLSAFHPSEAVLHKLHSKYKELICHPYTVAVQVRTYSKQIHDLKLHPFLGFDYYREAMSFFPKEALFVVFSDRIKWCKHHFPQQFDRPMIFIEGNDGVEDLFLISKMKHQIFGNSTFGWWGSYLNQYPGQVVVAPKYWRDPEFQPNFPYQDYLLPTWNLITPRFDLPYPEDMESHSDVFQSLNG